MLHLQSCDQSEAAGPAERERLGLLRAWLASASLKADFGRGAINEVRFVW